MGIPFGGRDAWIKFTTPAPIEPTHPNQTHSTHKIRTRFVDDGPALCTRVPPSFPPTTLRAPSFHCLVRVCVCSCVYEIERRVQ